MSWRVKRNDFLHFMRQNQSAEKDGIVLSHNTLKFVLNANVLHWKRKAMPFESLESQLLFCFASNQFEWMLECREEKYRKYQLWRSLETFYNRIWIQWGNFLNTVGSKKNNQKVKDMELKEGIRLGNISKWLTFSFLFVFPFSLYF